MALKMETALVRSPWRIRAYFSGGDPSSQVIGSFSIARQDAQPSTLTLASLFTPDVGQLELCTSEPLTIGVVYVLTWGANSCPVVFDVAPDDPDYTAAPEDPEAEVFGVDLDWLFGSPGPDGDCPQRRGQACLVHDLAAMALLRRGELVHMPTKGADLPTTISGSLAPAALLETQARLESEFRDDDRVSDLSVTTAVSAGDGQVEYEARVIPVALGVPLRVSNT